MSDEKYAVVDVAESRTAVALNAKGSIAKSVASSAQASVPENSLIDIPAKPGDKPDDTLRARTRGAEAPGVHRTRIPEPLLTKTVDDCGNATRKNNDDMSNVKRKKRRMFITIKAEGLTLKIQNKDKLKITARSKTF